MRKTVYLDTSIISFLYDNRKEFLLFSETTKRWWNESRQRYSVSISEETLNELNKGNYPNKVKLIAEALKINILDSEDQVFNIANIYIDNKLMPQTLSGDAIHLAYASFYKFDYLLTWNYKHLANANKFRHMKIINLRLDLHTPYIVTPIELFFGES